MLSKLKDDRLDVFMVWTNVYGVDNTSLAAEGKKILTDSRVRHYWDGEAKLVTEFGKTIVVPRDAPLAYDCYFLYDGKSEWGQMLPTPADWMHQIIDDDERFLEPAKLRRKLLELLAALPKK